MKSNRKKLMITFGTRPEAIKMAPLVHYLRRFPESFEVIVCVTAQHREMLDQVLEVFKIKPDVDLSLMSPGQDLFDLTSRVILGMRDTFREFKPEIVLVHGDTTTCFATAVAAFYAGIPVGHVEAGLRTNNLLSPFPEEFNRQVASKVSAYHFAPSLSCAKNLKNEGIEPSCIVVTGNTVIDALKWILRRIEKDPKKTQQLVGRFLEQLGFNVSVSTFILVTGHRRENFGEGIAQICQAIRELAQIHPLIHFVYPVHMNPNVQRPTREILEGLANVHLIPPQDYEPFVFLLKNCRLVLTDSGGIQEEAPSLGKPVLVMRETSERTDALEAGTVRLVGTNRHAIISSVSSLLSNTQDYHAMSIARNPYGDGNACQRIAEFLNSV